jgi:predicted GIY-YIG superfamily endonuclease
VCAYESELPSGPAVYAFENLEDGKLYIGSSSNAYRRVQHHLYLLRIGKHRNRYLQRAYEKHRGKFPVFTLEALADCTLQELLRAEQRWISALPTTEPEHGYNIHPTPISAGYFPPSAARARLKPSLRRRRRGVLSEPAAVLKIEPDAALGRDLVSGNIAAKSCARSGPRPNIARR